MAKRVVPLLFVLFAPGVALAAPPADAEPSDRPVVQVPDPVDSNTATKATPRQPDESTTPEDDGQIASEDASAEGQAAPVESAPSDPTQPDAAPQPDPEPQPQPQPEAQPEPDMANLLDSDEAEPERLRIRVAPPDTRGVDHREKMRSYYARVYRPEHNPSRLYFAARGAYAISGTNGASGTSGGGRMGFVTAEIGQTWNYVGYAIGPTLFAGSMTYGDNGIETSSPILVGGGPSLSLGRLALVGRGFVDLRLGYNFFYAPVATTRAGEPDPADAAPHGPKVQVDMGLLLHDSERRRFRHGLGTTIGWQMLAHSLAGDYPMINTFTIGFGYFFG